MTTCELIENGNLYRAIGGGCWLATYAASATEDGVRRIKPMVRRVMVVKPVAGSTCHVAVAAVRGDGKLITASPSDLFDSREDAHAKAVQECEWLDGTVCVWGNFTYRYIRPQARKVKPAGLAVRVKQVAHDGFVVEYRDPKARKWRPVYGLGTLSRWKANDTARRLKAGLDVPGYWRNPGVEYVELVALCDYEV